MNCDFSFESIEISNTNVIESYDNNENYFSILVDLLSFKEDEFEKEATEEYKILNLYIKVLGSIYCIRYLQTLIKTTF